jgi:hypothetical protein
MFLEYLVSESKEVLKKKIMGHFYYFFWFLERGGLLFNPV